MVAVCFNADHAPASGVARRASDRGPDRVIARAFATLRKWRRRIHDREELAALDDRMLSDIGITRAEAEFLSRKPFWRE
jgi:uncharacterized protein YjiS (DUF1127 family)